MENQKWLEIARTGTFTDSSGRSQTFTESDLSAIAASYDPQKRDCPLVFGHPKSDSAPAFGWAQKLKAENGKLFAQFALVPDAVKELVAKGHYRHVSISLMPDRTTLRHVALLGAAQPAIDGLKAVELASGEDAITVEFSTLTKESHMPDNAEREIGALKERLAALEKENADLKKQAQLSKDDKDKSDAEKKAAEEKKAEAEAKAEKMASEFAAYKGQIEQEKRDARISALVKAGKLTPAEKAQAMDFASKLAQQNETINFAAQDGTTETISLEERYLRELEKRPSDGRVFNFSGDPGHASEQKNNFNLADMTAKL